VVRKFRTDPALFTRGADWRFLLPVSKESHILLIGDELDAVVDLFRILDIAPSVLDSKSPFSVLPKPKPAQPDFDIVAIPFGISPDGHLAWLSIADVFRDIRERIRPGGAFLFGFTNVWVRRNPKTFPASPGRVQRLLRQAGFASVDVYVAYPDLITPEYILPMKPSILSFALQFRLRNKLSTALLRVFSMPLVMGRVANLLPFYFAVARV